MHSFESDTSPATPALSDCHIHIFYECQGLKMQLTMGQLLVLFKYLQLESRCADPASSPVSDDDA